MLFEPAESGFWLISLAEVTALGAARRWPLPLHPGGLVSAGRASDPEQRMHAGLFVFPEPASVGRRGPKPKKGDARPSSAFARRRRAPQGEEVGIEW